MRKYTSKKQKVEMYSAKYGLSKEYVYHILTEKECVLTFEELKIKYDCPTLGELPDWATDESISSVIWKTIHEKFDLKYSTWTTPEELYQTLQLFIRCRLHLYKNLSNIKTAVINRLVWLLREHLGRGSYIAIELDKPIKNSKIDDENVTYSNMITKTSQYTEERYLVDNILSIKDTDIKNLLIVLGYLVCDIDLLEKSYIELVQYSPVQVQNNLYKLQQKSDTNEQLRQDRYNGKLENKRIRRITVLDVMKALQIPTYLLDNIKSSVIKYNLI